MNDFLYSASSEAACKVNRSLPTADVGRGICLKSTALAAGRNRTGVSVEFWSHFSVYVESCYDWCGWRALKSTGAFLRIFMRYHQGNWDRKRGWDVSLRCSLQKGWAISNADKNTEGLNHMPTSTAVCRFRFFRNPRIATKHTTLS